MGYRRFDDADGNNWEVRDSSRAEWRFEPMGGNPNPAQTCRVPHYESDPFELSERELRDILLAAQSARSRPAANPFGD